QFYGSILTETRAIPRGALFVRGWFLLPSDILPLAPRLINLQRDANNAITARVGDDSHFYLDYVTAYKTSNQTVTAGQWVGLEIELVEGDAGAGAVREWLGIDGTTGELTDLAATGVSTNPYVSEVGLGFYATQTGAIPKAFEVYLDDVAIDTTRIGCD